MLSGCAEMVAMETGTTGDGSEVVGARGGPEHDAALHLVFEPVQVWFRTALGQA